jgi:hypothetical protein
MAASIKIDSKDIHRDGRQRRESKKGKEVSALNTFTASLSEIGKHKVLRDLVCLTTLVSDMIIKLGGKRASNSNSCFELGGLNNG